MPRWPYRLGKQTKADHDTLTQAKALVLLRYARFVPADDPALRYGLALNDAGFFWEAHEILEAVWKVAPQRGRDRISASRLYSGCQCQSETQSAAAARGTSIAAGRTVRTR